MGDEARVTMVHSNHPVMKDLLEQIGSGKNKEVLKVFRLNGVIVDNPKFRTNVQMKSKLREMINGNVPNAPPTDHAAMYKELGKYICSGRGGEHSSASSSAGQVVKAAEEEKPSRKRVAGNAAAPAPVIDQAADDEQPVHKRRKTHEKTAIANPSSQKVVRMMTNFMQEQRQLQQNQMDKHA